MAESPLEKYRRQGAPGAPEVIAKPVEPGELKPYRAFDPQDRNLSLDIHRVLGTSYSPSYGYLLNVAYDNEYFTNFVLYYTFMRVEVRGKNLREVIKGIKLRRVEFIQDFHPEEFAPPAEGEALIDSIEIHWLGEMAEMHSGTEKNPQT
jgi:hypothetical protein